MSDLILPPTLAVLLMACTPCFQARSVVVFRWLVLGWIQCQGRRTLTGVALASGAIGQRHIAVFHRYFSRASWSLDALGQAVFTLARKWLPADQPLVVLGDDTLARKGGKSIALASRHHDPLLSSARQPFASFGPVWVVLALWLPLPFGRGRGFALPVLFRLSVSAKRGGERHRAGRTQRRTGPRLRAARTAHAQHRQLTKLDLRGDRLPALQQLIARRRRWTALPLVLDGRAVTPRLFTFTARWYGALRTQPVRIVVVREPSGHRHAEAFFCTDLTQDPAVVLQTYAARWTLEVTFHDSQPHLGFGQAQNQASQAVARTAPFAGLVGRLVLLWAAAHLQQGGTLGWIVRPWYRTKTTVAFPDLLMALRHELWRAHFLAAPVPSRRRQNPAPVPHHTQPRAA